ncbi:MAG TPA: hypothetical protein VGR87_03080 [Candidatus Limnocylindria bacterium]|nr:hypothetical protein [Candidatus Limnocylindria bacterium]
MELERVAPEGFVPEGVETKDALTFDEQRARVTATHHGFDGAGDLALDIPARAADTALDGCITLGIASEVLTVEASDIVAGGRRGCAGPRIGANCDDGDDK